jgi:hypothetical protein
MPNRQVPGGEVTGALVCEDIYFAFAMVPLATNLNGEHRRSLQEPRAQSTSAKGHIRAR